MWIQYDQRVRNILKTLMGKNEKSQFCREPSLMRALLVSNRKASLSEFAATLENLSIHVVWSETENGAISMIGERAMDIIIADEALPHMTGLQFARKLVAINPMIHCAAVSSLSPEEFHEASEGLGLLMQLPVRPKRAHAEDLVKHLRSIMDLTGKVTGKERK
jgi:CheY-like chemotaxis protein